MSNDADGDRMIVGQVFDAQNGTVSLASNGQVSFTPDANFNGTASFKYAANTPEGGRAEATVYVDVTPTNDAPVAVNDGGFETDEDTPFLIQVSDLLEDDQDIDGDVLTVSEIINGPNVSVELTDDGFVQVTPTDYFFGSAYFDYVVSDGNGGTDTGRVSFFVNPVNNAPAPQGDSFTVVEDNILFMSTSELLDNDVEYDGDTLTVTSVSGAFGGTVRLLENDTVEFRTWADFNGEARYTYSVSDGQGGTETAQVTIDVTPVNDAPTAAKDDFGRLSYLRGFEDIAIDISIADLLANDSDLEGSAITFGSFASFENGTVIQLDADTLRFTPDQDYWGAAAFQYLISDEEGLTDAARVDLYFENVGDAPPVAGNDVFEVYEDVVTIIPVADLLANDTDIDRDPLEIISASPLPQMNGSIAFNADGDIVFTPNLNSETSSGFRYTVTDNADGTDTGIVDIVMIPVNDDPEIVDDTTVDTPLDIPWVIRISDLLLNDSDVDRNDIVSFRGVEGLSIGAHEVYNNEFIVVRNASGFAGLLALEYSVQDTSTAFDTGFVRGEVAPAYTQRQEGSERRDLLIGNDLNETISGLEGDDDIYANGGINTVFGGAGSDTIETGNQTDTVYGGDDNDDIKTFDGNDLIIGGDGADTIDGGEGFDSVDLIGSNIGVRAGLDTRLGQGGHAQGDIYTNIEALYGTEYSDELSGNDEANTLGGRGGNDRLRGQAGDDLLLGNQGDDTFEGGLGADTLDGGEGSDTADYFLSSNTSGITVDLGAGTASGEEANGDVLVSIENVIGTDFADAIAGDENANNLQGGRGDDTLIGLGGDDVLIGGRGADSFFGGEGEDIADYSLSLDGVSINLADGSAGGGDAEGDVFDGIEIVQASFHDDTIIGDEGDNVIRGGRGADTIDGAGGFDTADYSQGDEGVHINLATRQGLSGEALGDQLSSIEKLVGSTFQDTFEGSDGNDVFDGGFGDDLLAGARGSDTYEFGFDSAADRITEVGDAGDIDRVAMLEGVAPKDVSLLRDGDDLFIELENDDGLLIDTLRVVDHFLGTETGIEEITFTDGTTWDRDTIESLIREGRFNAQDDIVRFQDEDVVARINPVDLIANDATEGLDALTIVSVTGLNDATASIAGDGYIEFLGPQDFFGDAFFEYTVRDAFGRESSAEVEVNLRPVNDAPVGVDDFGIEGTEDQVLYIPIADLVLNDTDVDGDALTIIGLGPLLDVDGDPLNASSTHPLTNGKGKVSGEFIEFEARPDHFGFAGFTYTVSDGNGGTSTAQVELFINPVNDAPRSHTDNATIRLSQSHDFTVRELLSNDYDIEGDAFNFVQAHSASNGSFEYIVATGLGETSPEDDIIRFTPDALGDASFEYTVIDDRGAQASHEVEIDVVPLNDPPSAENDAFTTLEDDVLIIDPADLLANDTDPNGDVLFVSGLQQFPTNGRVAFTDDGMIAFRPRDNFNGQAGFEYQISDGEGGYDTGYVRITIEPRNDGPILFDDISTQLEDVPNVFLPGEAFGNDIDLDGDVIFFDETTFVGTVSKEREGQEIDARDALNAGGVVGEMTLVGGAELPAGVHFDAQAWLVYLDDTIAAGQSYDLEFTIPVADDAPSYATETQLIVTLTKGTTDQADLTTLIVPEELRIVKVDNGYFVATQQNGDALPIGWIFDPVTLELSVDPSVDFGENPEVQAVRLSYISNDFLLTDFDSTYASKAEFSFTALVRPDAPQSAFDSVNTFLRTSDLVPGSGVFAFDPEALEALSEGESVPASVRLFDEQQTYVERSFSLGGEHHIEDALQNATFVALAQMSDGSPIPSWLNFDAKSATFSGILPGDSDPVELTVQFADAQSVQDGTPVILSEKIVQFSLDDAQELRSGVQISSDILVLDAGFQVPDPDNFDYSVHDSYDHLQQAQFTVSAQLEGARPLPEWLDFNAETNTLELSGIAPAVDAEIARVQIVFDSNSNVDQQSTDNSFALEFLIDPQVGIPAELNGMLQTTSYFADRGQFGIALGDADAIAVTKENSAEIPSWLNFDAESLTFSGRAPDTFVGSIPVRMNVADDLPFAVLFDVVIDQSYNIDPASGFGTSNDGEYVYLNAPTDFYGTFAFDYSAVDVKGASSETDGRVFINVEAQPERPDAITDVILGQENTPVTFTLQDVLANDFDRDGHEIRVTSIEAPLYTGSERAEVILNIFDRLSPVEGATYAVALADGSALPDWVNFDPDTGLIIATIPPQTDEVLSIEVTQTLPAEVLSADASTQFNDAIAAISSGGANVINVNAQDYFVHQEGAQYEATLGDGSLIRAWMNFDADTGLLTGTVPDTFTDQVGIQFTQTLLPVVNVEVFDQHYEDTFDGELEITLNTVEIDGAAAFIIADPTATYAAVSTDGSDLPEWMVLDSVTGLVSATVPLEVDQTFEIEFTRMGVNGIEVTTVRQALDGNVGVTFEYRPEVTVNGTINIGYTITDDKQGPTDGLIQILLDPANDVPVARNDTFFGLEDIPLVFTLEQILSNDTDADGDDLTVTLGDVSNGRITEENGTFTFTPNLNYAGKTSIQYTVDDGNGGIDTARIDLEIDETNRAPLAPEITLDGIEDTPIDLAIADIMAVVSDPNAEDTVEFVSISASAPTGVVFEKPNGDLQFTPQEDFNGVVEFEYRVTDGRLTTDGVVAINFAPVNDAPTVFDDVGYEVNEDQPLAISFAELMANDVDVDGDAFSLVSVLDGDNGYVHALGDTAVFTPRFDYFGNAAFKYVVEDVHGAQSTGQVFITVLPVDDFPVVVADPAFEMNEDAALTIDGNTLIANDIDPDGGVLTLAGIDGPNLTDLGNGLFEFTPVANENGTFDFTYEVENQYGARSTGAFQVNVAPQADDPVAQDDLVRGTEDVSFSILISDLLANDEDVDGETLSLTLVNTNSGINVVNNGDGTLTITPDANYYGISGFGYTIDDGTGRTSSADVTVEITAINDAPIAVDDTASGTEDQSFFIAIADILANDTDADGDSLNLSDILPQSGIMVVDNSDGTLTVTPDSDFHGSTGFSYAVNDGTGLSDVGFVNVDISAQADAPVAGDDAVSATEDTVRSISIADLMGNDTDADGDILSISSLTGQAGVSVVDLGDGTIELTPDADFNGTSGFTYVLSDGTGLTDEGAVTVTVAAVNDAPETNPDMIEGGEQEIITISIADLLANDTDIDGDTLSISTVSSGSNYTAVLDGLGNLVVSRDPDFSGALAIEYQVSDGGTETSSTVVINLLPSNQAPEIGSIDDLVVNEDEPFGLNIGRRCCYRS